MNELTEILVNICVLIAAVWAAGKAALSLYSNFYRLTHLSEELQTDQGETERQLKAIWKKLDRIDQLTNARLDRIERQLNYVAGSMHIHLNNLEGNHD